MDSTYLSLLLSLRLESSQNRVNFRKLTVYTLPIKTSQFGIRNLKAIYQKRLEVSQKSKATCLLNYTLS